MSQLSGKDLLRKLVREYSQDRWRKLVRELVRQELDEANSTASVGGSYNTPHAFQGSNKKGKIVKDKQVVALMRYYELIKELHNVTA